MEEEDEEAASSRTLRLLSCSVKLPAKKKKKNVPELHLNSPSLSVLLFFLSFFAPKLNPHQHCVL